MARVEVEGLSVDPEAPIAPGDLYLARRNGDWQLLTCGQVITPSPDFPRGSIIAREAAAYPYDLSECAKVLPA